MSRTQRRWLQIAVVAGGVLFQGTCEAVWNTIGLAFSIVDVWV